MLKCGVVFKCFSFSLCCIISSYSCPPLSTPPPLYFHPRMYTALTYVMCVCVPVAEVPSCGPVRLELWGFPVWGDRGAGQDAAVRVGVAGRVGRQPGRGGRGLLLCQNSSQGDYTAPSQDLHKVDPYITLRLPRDLHKVPQYNPTAPSQDLHKVPQYNPPASSPDLHKVDPYITLRLPLDLHKVPQYNPTTLSENLHKVYLSITL